MKLLFKQVIKNSLKDWIQLLVLTVLVILTSILFVSCFSVDQRLEKANKFMGAGDFRYDYYYRYNSISDYHNGQTITPWSAITDEKIEYYKKTLSNDNPYTLEYALPVLSIGNNKDAVLKQLNPSWFTVDAITFTVKFGTNYSMKNIFSINNINMDSIHFKNSLIGKLSQKIKIKNNSKLIKKYQTDIDSYFEILAKTPIAFSVLDLMSTYAKINRTVDLNQITNFVTEVNKKWDTKIYSDKSFNLANNDKSSNNYLFKTGMQGSLATLIVDTIKTTTTSKGNFNYIYRDENGVDSSVYSDPLKFASYQIGSIYKVDKSYDDNFSLNKLLMSYQKVLGDLTNFNVTFCDEYYAWDFKNNLKYKVINWQQIFENNQMRLLDVYQDDENWNHNDNSYYVVVSPSYQNKFNVNIGDAINFGKDENKSLYVGAIGSDIDNIYPLIYDQDWLPNNKNEVIIYLNPLAFQNTLKKYFTSSSIKDNSHIFLKYLASNNMNKEQDFITYKTYLNDDFTKLGNNKSRFTNFQQTDAQFLRNNRLTQVISIYRFINLGLILFFYLILLFSLIFIIKKIVDKKRIENGILKANGFSSFKIAFSYLSYGIFMTIVGSTVGYTIGIFAQIPTINVFNNYFIIPNKLNVGWDSFLINFVIILSICFSIIFLISYLQVKQHPLALINPNSKLNSENLMTKLAHKIKLKKFISRFRLILLSVSIKNIVLLFMVILIATIGITAAALIPTSLFQISNDYYYNLNYKNKTSYQGVIYNNPLTRYQTYFWKGSQAVEKNNQYPLKGNNVIPDYIYDYQYINGIKSANKKWIDTWNIDPKEIRYYQSTIQNAILYNFASTKGGSFSLGLFKDLSTRYHSDDLNYSISTLLCSIIPTAFGKNPIVFDNSKPFESWNYCLESATESLLPADIKQIWVSKPYRQDQFNFTFGTVAVNKMTDDLYTSYYSNINNENIETIGITQENKTIKGLDKTKLLKVKILRLLLLLMNIFANLSILIKVTLLKLIL